MSATRIPIINKQLEEIRDAILMTAPSQGEDLDWRQVQNVVRAGAGAKWYPVGTQFIVEKETSMTASLGEHTGVTAVSVSEETFLAHAGVIGSGLHEFKFDGAAWIYHGEPVRLSDFGITPTGTPASGDEILITEAFDNILFDVVDHRTVTDPADGVEKPAMFLLMHHVIYGRPFDEPEAMYCASDAALEAGTYNFTLPADYDTSHGGGKTYQFTTTQAVPKGGQIVLSWPYNQNPGNIKTYSGPASTTVIETLTISEGTDGTSLGTVDGSTTNMNYMQRIRYGSNNYKESALRQWINSKAPAGGWWNPTNIFDRPSSYANVAGLLHGMDAEFLAAARAITVPCKTNNTYELPGWTKNAAYTVADRMWLASRNELGYGTENVAEGSVFKAYNGAANVDRIKYDISERYVYSDGSLNGSNAINGSGAVAACAIM